MLQKVHLSKNRKIVAWFYPFQHFLYPISTRMAIVAFNVIFTIFEDVLEKKADSIFWGKLFCNLIRIHIYFTFFQIWKHWECWIVFYLNKSLLPNRSSSKPTNPNPYSYGLLLPSTAFWPHWILPLWVGSSNPLGLLPSLLPSSSNDPCFCHWAANQGPRYRISKLGSQIMLAGPLIFVNLSKLDPHI